MFRSEHTRLKTALVIASAAVLLLSFLSSSILIVLEADHDCCGEGCEICAVLSRCNELLRRTPLLFVALICALAAAVSFILPSLSLTGAFVNPTPVLLKTRLND